MKFIKPYLVFSILVWLPWGLICIFYTDIIAEIIGVTALTPSGNTDLRVMYGGVQTAIGLMAVFALRDERLVRQFLITLATVASCLALSRFYGLVVDQSGTGYTWGVLGYESFASISAFFFLGQLKKPA